MRQFATAFAVILVGVTISLPVGDRSAARRPDPPVSQLDDLARCLARELAGPHARYALVTGSSNRLAFITIWRDGSRPSAQLRIEEDASGSRFASLRGAAPQEAISLHVEKAMRACRLQS